MKRTDFFFMPCSVARGLGRVGEWWSILILRDAFSGMTRFSRQYNARPPRQEYILTKAGCSFKPVLLTFIAWGNENFSPDGASLLLVNRKKRQAGRSGADRRPSLRRVNTDCVNLYQLHMDDAATPLVWIERGHYHQGQQSGVR